MKWLNHKKLLWSAFALLLCCLFLASCFPPVAYAATYQMTGTELTQLEQNLAQLEANSKSKGESLATLKTQLQTANERLTKLSGLQKTTQESLMNAEASLKAYEKEMKHKQAVKERQRNLWIAIAGIVTIWTCVK